MAQSPCLVATYLWEACRPKGTVTVPPLTGRQKYSGPTLSSANNYSCSSVVYNLISACAFCQHHAYIPWIDWDSNCTDNPVPLGQYILPIPPQTNVPGWAYITPDAMNGTFNPAIAQAESNLAESTTLSTPVPTSPIPTSVNPSTPTNAPSTGSSKGTNVGAIAGGVVGGAVIIATVSIVVLLLIKRSRKGRIAPSVAFSMGNYGSSPPVSRLSHPVGPYSPIETPTFLDPSRYRVTPEPMTDSDSGIEYTPSQSPSLVMPQPRPVGAQPATNPFI